MDKKKELKIKGASKKGKHPYIDFDPQDPPKKIERLCHESVRRSLEEKSLNSDLDFSLLFEVFERGIDDYYDSKVGLSRPDLNAQQWAFARVNSFISGGRALDLDSDLITEAKKKEIKARKLSKKAQAGKTLGDILHGSAKLDSDTAKHLTKHLGLHHNSNAYRAIHSVAKQNDEKKAHNKLRRQITKEVKAKLASQEKKKSSDLDDHWAELNARHEARKKSGYYDKPKEPVHREINIQKSSDVNIQKPSDAAPKKTGILHKIGRFLKGNK